jgi:hypothetical protein
VSEQPLLEPEQDVGAAVEEVKELDEVEDQSSRPRRLQQWIAPAWFFFGIIVGIAGFAAYTALTAKSMAASAPIDAVAMRSAARQGVLDAIATLNAPNAQPSSQESQEPAVVDPSQFTVRAANRTGNPDAKVTIIEFSDFQ